MQRNANLYKDIFSHAYLKPSDYYFFKNDPPKYKFNIIGAGMIGMEHLNVTLLEGRADIYGIYDVDPHSTQYMQKVVAEKYDGKQLVVYDTLEAACNDDKVDGLIICTPNYVHIQSVKEAVKSGKHIMLEKPMATTLEDAQSIMTFAENYKNVFQIGLQYRYKAIYQEARQEALVRKSLGEIKSLSIVEHRLPFLDKVENWNKFSCYSGGTLVEKCCHYFDLLNLFAQSEASYVYAVGSQAVNYKDFNKAGNRSDILDQAIVTIVYKNGVTANFNLCMFSPMFYEEITILGDQGRLRAYENDDYLPNPKPTTHLEVLASEYATSKIMTPCFPKVIQESGHKGGTYFEHKNFIDNIEGKKTDTATAKEGYQSVLVGIAAEKAVQTGKVVYVDEL